MALLYFYFVYCKKKTMNKSIEELRIQAGYRAVSTISGELKSKFLKDCERGEKPAQIVRQALKLYYSSEHKSRF